MVFDLKRWRSDVRAWWAEHAPDLKTASIDSAYALLASSTWMPFLAAYAQDPGTATTALVSITAGIGSNLVANVVQDTYDRARAGQQVRDQVQEDAETLSEMDAVLQSMRALDAARDALGERWDDFARQLVREMAALPGESDLIVTLGDGTVLGGSVIAGDLTMRDSTYVGGDQVTIERAQTVHIGEQAKEGEREEAERQERALRAYLERLAAESNVLHLRGLDPKAADVTSQETMSLAAVYTVLDTNRRIPADNEKLTEEEWLDQELVDRGREGQGEPRVIGRDFKLQPLSALEAASRFDRLVLLGDPGAGKSTFVSHLAFHLSRARLEGADLEHLPDWGRGPLVPIRVVLRDVVTSADTAGPGTAEGLWRCIARVLAEADLADAVPALRKRLDAEALLLLDGLDEVDAEARRWLLDAVEDFALTHHGTPVLVTCRVYAYQESQWRLSRFEEATLAPFDNEKIDHFITAWYTEVARLGLMPAAEAGERASRLRDAVRRPDLRLLAPNPLLLTMMTLLHSSWGRLPEDRVQLYSEIVELLLARWEQSRLGREALTRAQLSPRNLRFALEEVAYRAHALQEGGEGTADVPESLLREVLQGYLEGDWNRAGDAIRYVRERAGLLLERKPHVYAFPHRTVQEYLAGCHLAVRDDFAVQAADLLRDDETRWREPFLLAVGKTGRAENRVSLALTAVDELCPRGCTEPPEDERAWRCAWLAGEGLVEIGVERLRRREPWTVRLERVAGWLGRLLEAGALEPVERAGAGRVLARLGDPRDLDAVVFVPGGPFLMGSDENDEAAYADERPQHTVEVADFSIGKVPVTNEQYARFVEAGGYDERQYWTEMGWAWRTGAREPDLSLITDQDLKESYAEWLAGRPPERRDRPFWWHDPRWNLPNHPVVGVSWYEALAYTRWLAKRLDRPCRLPTEAEWEKAARGPVPSEVDGTTGRIYPWGDEWAEDRANTSEAEVGRTTAVGAFPAGASPCGALDMSGNVWEWCSSAGYSEAPYPYRADDGREDLEREVVRALRGGSWGDDRRYARCAYRGDDRPDYFNDNVGFRVVFPGSPPSES